EGGQVRQTQLDKGPYLMMHRILLTTSALALLIFSGVVHGLWTDRWSEQLDLGEAARALEQLPYTIKDWHGADVPMERDPRAWLAAENPRLAYAGERVLHKMYVLREIVGNEGPNERDPCVDFLQDAIPVLQGQLYVETK